MATPSPLDEPHERSGYLLILTGILVVLASGAGLLLTQLATEQREDLMPYVYFGLIGAVLCVAGTVTLVGLRRYAGLRAEGPGGSKLEISGEVSIKEEDK
jgi:hypothetical protein